MLLVSDVLDAMSILSNEMDLTAGGINEAQGIIAIKLAQQYFETVAGAFPRAYQTALNTVQTVPQTETTSYPSALIRIDGIWLLDSNGNELRRLERIDDVGGHVPQLPWPLQVSFSPGVGGPSGYYANQSAFYWLPMPDGAYSARIFGLWEQPKLVDRTSIINYPRVTLAWAQFAVKLLSIGIDDDTTGIDALANQLFNPLLRTARNFDRSGPRGRVYDRVHST